MSINRITGKITRNKYCEVEQYHEIEWTIEGFIFYTAENIDYDSPAFTTEDMDWSFTIFPNGEAWENSVGWVGLYLVSRNTDWTVLKNANLSFGVKKLNGTVDVIKEDVNYVFSEHFDYWRDIRFLERSKLFSRWFELAPPGGLIITCTLRLNDPCNVTSRMTELSGSFRKIFTSKIGCDATLRVKNVEFPVHKGILTSRSPVFGAMFEAEMKGKNTGVVDIADCHPDSFRDFLQYIYSGEFENSSGDIFELYRIAHKYCEERLKSICVLHMIRDMSIDNVIDVAILGDQFDERTLLIKGQNFFSYNVAKVLLTDKWKSLLRKDPSLANSLLINMTKILYL